MSSSTSFAPLIARLHQGSGQMPMWSGVGLACNFAIALAGQTTTVFNSRRVVVVSDHYMMEDRVDHCSS